MLIRDCQNAVNASMLFFFESNSFFSKSTSVVSFNKVAIKTFVPLGLYWFEKLWIPFLHCNPCVPEIADLFVNWAHFVFQNSCCSKPTCLSSSFKFWSQSFKLYLLQFCFRVSIDNFLPDVDDSFLNVMKNILYVGIKILFDQNWQKWFHKKGISKFQSVLSESADLKYSIKVWIDSDIL